MPAESSPRDAAEAGAARALRRILSGLFLLGCVGTAGELLLLEHFEDAWQWAPLVLLGAGLALGLWRAFDRRPAVLRLFRAAMALFVAAGLAGLYLHYRGNAEFELEMIPSLSGFELFREALGGATPALAPGMMIELGLLGWTSTFRHPALRAAGTRKEPSSPNGATS